MFESIGEPTEATNDPKAGKQLTWGDTVNGGFTVLRGPLDVHYEVLLRESKKAGSRVYKKSMYPKQLSNWFEVNKSAIARVLQGKQAGSIVEVVSEEKSNA